ncbi:unnamed protein product [Rotaria socialis]|uniref:Theromacin n=1 Tax=Rotaria socialis TaxID=392032 RepID=A0A821A909_9BILA|nr:unnamed protein product [Rotaria socialis]CAF4559181.1 unnamed protein product [Rotaria socialis]CAF4573578.1 unnamed protein product [Rotaria socialis]
MHKLTLFLVCFVTINLIDSAVSGWYKDFLNEAEIIYENGKACWKSWSRCTEWSSGATGYLWQSCNERCKCKGYLGGNCRPVPNYCPVLPKGSTINQCKCYGTGPALSNGQKIRCGL